MACVPLTDFHIPRKQKVLFPIYGNLSDNMAYVLLQVFVANPNKTPPIQDILVKNKEKLVEFLTNFHNDRTGDVVFST